MMGNIISFADGPALNNFKLFECAQPAAGKVPYAGT